MTDRNGPEEPPADGSAATDHSAATNNSSATDHSSATDRSAATDRSTSTDGGAHPVERGADVRDGYTPADVGRALVPLVLLGLFVGLLFVLPLFGGVQGGEPLPEVSVSHVTLPNTEMVVLHVANAGATPVAIEQVLVNDAYWAHTVSSAGDPATLQPLEQGTIEVPYHWTPGWDLEVAIVLANGATFHQTIVAPQPSPGLTADLLGTLAVLGLFVGVVPVVLGMLWFPLMRRLSDEWLHGVLALSVGVLVFLGVDAGFEAFEVAHDVPGGLNGPIVVILGALGTLLLVQAASRWAAGDGTLPPLGLAYLVALGIGLHNLAEGLAIGGAFALGRVSLGALLVVGFMVHNVTEGPAVVAPLADENRTSRPSLWHFGALGLLAGAPVVFGGWIGSAAVSPTLGALFLAIGVGAIAQVVIDLLGMIRQRGDLSSIPVLLGLLAGLLVMYATGLLVAL